MSQTHKKKISLKSENHLLFLKKSTQDKHYKIYSMNAEKHEILRNINKDINKNRLHFQD